MNLILRMHIHILISILLCFSVTTISANTNYDSYVLGFGSCITEKRDQPIWSAIEKEDINEFFFMGDNVYGDSEDGLLQEMKASYEKQRVLFPEWLFKKKLNAIWDDHDYGKNDGGTEYPLKKEAQKLFLEFWNVKKDDPRHNRDGIYFSEKLKIGDLSVNLIGLDTRYHRSPLDQTDKPYYPTQDKSKTILGVEQWEWLENELSKENDLLIIVSSIQVLATNHVFEKWHNFPHERERLLKLLENISSPVIILSGDRHKAGLYRSKNIIEMTSSSMNKPISRPFRFIWDLLFKETDDLLNGEMYYGENYGVLTIGVNQNLMLELKGIDGELILQHTIKKGALKAPSS